jgi:uncharacterized beta-barrel protein YwiB (DUF1934 family)
MEMEKEVIISIRGVQQSEEAGDDNIELVTAGRLIRHPSGDYTLHYEESELTGLEGTSTTFLIQPRRVTLTREGQVNSQMVFEEGRKHLSLYDTPYGAMEVGVSARRVRSTIGDRGGELEVRYALEIDHAIAGQNLVHIEVKETPEQPLLQ